MSEMNLVEHMNEDLKTYILTESKDDLFVSGSRLADAFDENLTAEGKKIFLKTIGKGKVNNGTLEELTKDFDLTKVPKSKEQDLLSKMLIQKDSPLIFEEEPRTFRKNTIKLLLNMLNESETKIKDRDFVNFAYHVKGSINGEADKTLYGWYYYQFNEFWQIANTSILTGVLANLHDNSGVQWDVIMHLVKYTTAEVLTVLKEEKIAVDKDIKTADFIESLDGNEFELLVLTNNFRNSSKIAFAILAIFATYKNNLEDLTSLKIFSESISLKQDGEPCHYFLTEFQSKKELSLEDFIKDYILKKIILRHQFVALRKMRTGNLSTQKFILEDFKIRYLGNFDAASTGPRIYNLMSFIEDLRIIDKNQKITAFGNKILKELV